MQDDRARIEQIDAQIARYDADLSRRHRVPTSTSNKARLWYGFVVASVGSTIYLFVGVPVMSVYEVATKAMITLFMACALICFLGGCLMTGLFEDVAARQLERKEEKSREGRRRLVEQQRARLVAEREELARDLERQMSGGLSMSQDEAQRGELTVSEDLSSKS